MQNNRQARATSTSTVLGLSGAEFALQELGYEESGLHWALPATAAEHCHQPMTVLVQPCNTVQVNTDIKLHVTTLFNEYLALLSSQQDMNVTAEMTGLCAAHPQQASKHASSTPRKSGHSDLRPYFHFSQYACSVVDLSVVLHVRECQEPILKVHTSSRSIHVRIWDMHEAEA